MKYKRNRWIFELLGVAMLMAILVGSIEASEKETDIDYLKIPFYTINGEQTSLEEFKGKVILVVNVASKCGLTSQYEGLEALYREYKERSFTIVAFPANNFLNQEPGSNEEIAMFCKTNYDVSFPLMKKVSVKGKDQHPLYLYLTKHSPFSGKIRWNFDKFLLNKEGEVVARFSPRTKPFNKKLVKEIDSLLQGS